MTFSKNTEYRLQIISPLADEIVETFACGESCEGEWTLTIAEGSFLDAVDSFLNHADIAAEQFDVDLSKDATLWLLYEYEEQCNLEFDAGVLAEIASRGMTLCVSCWKLDTSRH